MSTEDQRKEIARTVRNRRDALGLTQEQLAVAAAVSGATVRNIEAGKQVRSGTIRKIMLVLDRGNPVLPSDPYDGSERRHSTRRSTDQQKQETGIEQLIDLPAEDLARVLLSLPAEKAELVWAAYHQRGASQVAESNSAERRSR
jgi:transcriptional regulator with XRE-family HTH domain